MNNFVFSRFVFRWTHLIVNVTVQVLLGIPLELVHKYWRVGTEQRQSNVLFFSLLVFLIQFSHS